MKLCQWNELCKIDRVGSARKVVKCSSAVVKGAEGPSLRLVQEYLKTNKNISVMLR